MSSSGSIKRPVSTGLPTSQLIKLEHSFTSQLIKLEHSFHEPQFNEAEKKLLSCENDMKMEISFLSRDRVSVKEEVCLLEREMDLKELEKLNFEEKLQVNERKCEELKERVARLLEEIQVSNNREKRAEARCNKILEENLNYTKEKNNLILELKEKVKKLKHINLENEFEYMEKYKCLDMKIVKKDQEIEDLKHERLAAAKMIEELKRKNTEANKIIDELRLKKSESDKASKLKKIELENLGPKLKKTVEGLTSSGEETNLKFPVFKGKNGSSGKDNTPNDAEDVPVLLTSNSSGLSKKGDRKSVQLRKKEDDDHAHNKVTSRGSQSGHIPSQPERNKHKETRVSVIDFFTGNDDPSRPTSRLLTLTNMTQAGSEESSDSDEDTTLLEMLIAAKLKKARFNSAAAENADTTSPPAGADLSDSFSSDEEADVEEEVASDSTEEPPFVDVDLTDIVPVTSNFLTREAKLVFADYHRRKMVDERRVPVDLFAKQNLITFLENRGMYSTVSTAMPFVREVVLEFFANMLPSIADSRSVRYGKVYVRGKVYDFNPTLINNMFGTPKNLNNDSIVVDMSEAISFLSGGMSTIWREQLSSTCLTSLYSVLHKLAVFNWIPSTNTTIVTRAQAQFLYKLGTGMKINFGQHVFNIITRFATSKLASAFCFPSLIFSLLKNQGVAIYDNDIHSGEATLFSLRPQHLGGARVIDLPWVAPRRSAVGPSDVGIGADNIRPNMVQFSAFLVRSQIRTLDQQIESLQTLRASTTTILLSCQGGENDNDARVGANDSHVAGAGVIVVDGEASESDEEDAAARAVRIAKGKRVREDVDHSPRRSMRICRSSSSN